MAGTVPWLELGGQVALLLCPSHWGRALDPVRSRVDQVGMEAMRGAPCPMLRPYPPDQQQALKQLQAGHRQWTAGAAPGWAAG